jgi:hypothetical protein
MTPKKTKFETCHLRTYQALSSEVSQEDKNCTSHAREASAIFGGNPPSRGLARHSRHADKCLSFYARTRDPQNGPSG